jgi:hypothetical protein
MTPAGKFARISAAAGGLVWCVEEHVSKGRLLGVRGLVTALVQDVVDAEVRCTKAVTGPRTPRRCLS